MKLEDYNRLDGHVYHSKRPHKKFKVFGSYDLYDRVHARMRAYYKYRQRIDIKL